MSSNPLYGLRKVGTFVQLTGLPGRPVRQPVFAGCTWRLCDRRLWLVTKSALEVCMHDDALYKLTTFTFTFTRSFALWRTTAAESCENGTGASRVWFNWDWGMAYVGVAGGQSLASDDEATLNASESRLRQNNLLSDSQRRAAEKLFPRRDATLTDFR